MPKSNMIILQQSQRSSGSSVFTLRFVRLSFLQCFSTLLYTSYGGRSRKDARLSVQLAVQRNCTRTFSLRQKTKHFCLFGGAALVRL